MPDPGSPEEKKKMLVIGVLGLLLVGVGAFQFMPSAPTTPAPTKAAPAAQAVAASTATYTPDSISQLPVGAVASLEPRDPFEPDPALVPHDTTETPPVVTPPPPPRKAQPFPLMGHINPLPFAGPFGKSEDKPSVAVPSAQEEPASPGLKLTGVMNGPHPLAVLVNEKGGEQIVEVGASIDSDSRLLAIGHQEALILFRGKKFRLTTGGNPSEK